MCRHEDKYCPRCSLVFEYRLGNITQCQCFGITFSVEEKQLMTGEYADCLCRHCLIEIKNEFAVRAKRLPLPKTEH
jgi:hypothetical protein